jgi:protein SCO1/2
MNPVRIIAALAGISAGIAVGAIVLMRSAPSNPANMATAPSSALAPDPNFDMLSIPEFSLTDQDGETVTNDILDGHLTIVDFIFTNCPFICPPMTANMAYAQQRLEGTGVRFLSMSVDPERDTPERLRAFAGTYNADLSTWTFVTGDREQVANIIEKGLLLAPVLDNPATPINLPGGDTMANISHPGHFVLVSPDRRVIAMTNGTDRFQVETLIARARAAAAELAQR